ncbi:MAG: hypothetical protein F6K40_37105 [Okeania sp. SIO3I5]|uniref:hypothetical protein n=1 Tax=Okeania sp. SIO3I5 TaxID=2607805 RepID=UPI0013BE7531|nr:hypothetical protein [Okeania sp. SIO3I5]NEQ41514.1 hypothetical protein [Okeania sp. SIO3I5]
MIGKLVRVGSVGSWFVWEVGSCRRCGKLVRIGGVESLVRTGLKKYRVVNILAQTMNEQWQNERSPTPSFLEISNGFYKKNSLTVYYSLFTLRVAL